MKTTKIQWHPGFVAAMNLEFSKDRQGHMPVCISLTGKEWMQYPISHIWFGSLSERMEKEKMIRLIECAEKLTGKAEREFADSVLEVSIGANKQVIEELLGDERMCQALMEIMEPHLQLREKAGMKEGIKEGIKQGINGAVDTLRAFGHGDLEIKNAIMQRYVLSEEEAEEYVYGRNEKAER